MASSKLYTSKVNGESIIQTWQTTGVYEFDIDSEAPLYSIDTPPPTTSGLLHLGHVYSYTQTDAIARFWRMKGYNVYYPMGWDDNGLPTERLTERRLNIRAVDVGRQEFIKRCLEVSEKTEREYENLWKRIGLSVDWRYTYRTIDDSSRQIAQFSFIDLYNKQLLYREAAPAIWNPEMQTAIAQAELADLEREALFVTIQFELEDGTSLPIATTRPELLPACVAVFIHPADARCQQLVGKQVYTPLFRKLVPILADEKVEQDKGTGIVMCCTFGDVTDIEWWRKYNLPLAKVLERDGTLNDLAGAYAGLKAAQARQQIIQELRARKLVLNEVTITQSVRVHERDDTPVEYLIIPQWFIKTLEFKDRYLEVADQLTWHPDYMKSRYIAWVESLSWDWCISRQRYFGIPFPLWYSKRPGEEGKLILADPKDLPVDPLFDLPKGYSRDEVEPDYDVMDTWATSALSPQASCRGNTRTHENRAYAVASII